MEANVKTGPMSPALERRTKVKGRELYCSDKNSFEREGRGCQARRETEPKGYGDDASRTNEQLFQELVLNSESITTRNSGSESRAGNWREGAVREKRTHWTQVLHKNLLCAGNMVTKHNLIPSSGCDSITTARPLHILSPRCSPADYGRNDFSRRGTAGNPADCN